MSVQINIHGETAADALRELGGLSSGLLRSTGLTPATGVQMGQGAAIGPGGVSGSTDDPKATTPVEKPARGRGRPPKVADSASAETASGQAISTGGEREPEAPAVEEKAPEAPKVEEKAPEAPKVEPLTVDNVRAAAKTYIDKFTMAFAQVDLQDCLEDAVGPGIRAISQLDGNNQEQLKKAVDAFEAAGAVVMPVLDQKAPDFADKSAPFRYRRKTSALG